MVSGGRLATAAAGLASSARRCADEALDRVAPHPLISPMPLAPTALRAADLARWHAAGHWGAEPLGAVFARTVAARGAATALVDGVQRLSFAEWEQRAVRLAAALATRGVRPGELV
jgi:non-ribosomal peptide synthetase component F